MKHFCYLQEGYGIQLRSELDSLEVGGFIEIDRVNKAYTAKLLCEINKGQKRFKTETHQARPFGKERVFVARHQ